MKQREGSEGKWERSGGNGGEKMESGSVYLEKYTTKRAISKKKEERGKTKEKLNLNAYNKSKRCCRNKGNKGL
jgi:hypothetical protein